MSSQAQQTRQNLQRIDEQLDALVGISANQKVLAASIGTELQDQLEMMSEIDGHMDKTHEQVNQANGLLEVVKDKAGTCGAWILMALLIIAIVIVWVVDFNNE